MAEGIIERHPLGMLLIDAIKMKSLMIPSPNRCLDVINDILPVKARKEVDRLIAELQDAQFKLEFEATTTIEFVQSLTFLDEIQERIEPLQLEAQVRTPRAHHAPDLLCTLWCFSKHYFKCPTSAHLYAVDVLDEHTGLLLWLLFVLLAQSPTW